ncbi:MAG: HAMP domain-containing protein [Desulfamplus sp.]|nr:HAMP domain-containing protein [Desulfamplus sp.]MBF0258190.1 HAMP domain-containing protein [Desulfamplus sp.]
MINVACGSCGKNYRLDPKIIKSENAKFTCKDCGHLNPLDQYIKAPESPIRQTELEKQTSANPIRDTSVTSSESYAVSRDILQVTWRNRLQVKVNAVLIPLVVVIMATFTIITYIAEKQKMETDLKNASKVAAVRLSVYLVEAFWSLDDEILRESLKSEMMDKNIYAINLIDRSGKVIYLGYKRDQDWNLVENDILIEGSYIKSSEGIIKDSNKIGSVEVYFSSKFFQEQFNQSMYKLIITAILLLVSVSLAAYVVLNQMILSPIGRLTDIANKISIGNLDLEIPIESKDEIGVLADAFARMKVSMAFAIKQLRKR